MNTRQRQVIFALNLTPEQEEGILMSLSKLWEMSFRKVLGCYNGHHETSYIVAVPEDYQLQIIQRRALQYRQESILVIQETGDAILEYLDTGDKINLGQFREISPRDAQNLQNWTKIGETYYSTAS